MFGEVVDHETRLPQSPGPWASLGVTTSRLQRQPQCLQQCFQPAYFVRVPEAVSTRQSDPVHSRVGAPIYATQCNRKQLFQPRTVEACTTIGHNQNNLVQYDCRPLSTGYAFGALDLRSGGFHENTNELFNLPKVPYANDDGRKPPYSYAQLAAMAIWQAPNRRLTVAGIYDWISKTFQFYGKGSQRGWQNSIRHNLSLHTAFSKEERKCGGFGKGCWWVIRPGMAALVLPKKVARAESYVAQDERKPSQACGVTGCAAPTVCNHLCQQITMTNPRKVRRLRAMQQSPKGSRTAETLLDSHPETNETGFGTALRGVASPLHHSIPDSLPKSASSTSSTASTSFPVADARFWHGTTEHRGDGFPIIKKRVRSISSFAISDHSSFRKFRADGSKGKAVTTVSKPVREKWRQHQYTKEKLIPLRSSSSSPNPPTHECNRSVLTSQFGPSKFVTTSQSTSPPDQAQIVSQNIQLYRDHMAMGRILKSSPARNAVPDNNDDLKAALHFGCPDFTRPCSRSLFDFRCHLVPARHSPLNATASHKHTSSISNAANGVLSESTTRANSQLAPGIQYRVPTKRPSHIVTSTKTATSPPKNSTTAKSIQGVGKENSVASLRSDRVIAIGL